MKNFKKLSMYDENEETTASNSTDPLLGLGVVSNSEVFEHYGKPFTSGRDLWDFLTAHYNFTPKT